MSYQTTTFQPDVPKFLKKIIHNYWLYTLTDIWSYTATRNFSYTMIVTKLVACLLTSWIDTEKRVRSWTQYKCSRRSACHTLGARICICARV